MSETLDQAHQDWFVGTALGYVQTMQCDFRDAVSRYERPSAIFRPALSIDGNQWCALYGENLQDGVAGFGDSPADAMWDFDRNWHAKLKANP